MREHHLGADDIARVTARVHQGAIDVLGPVIDPQTVHQSKFSMGTVLGADRGPRPRRPGRVRRALARRARRAFARQGARWLLDAEVDAAYPARWIGKVEVRTKDGRTLDGARRRAEGRPRQHADAAPRLEDKALRLAAYRGGASGAEMRACDRAHSRAALDGAGRLPARLSAALPLSGCPRLRGVSALAMVAPMTVGGRTKCHAAAPQRQETRT